LLHRGRGAGEGTDPAALPEISRLREGGKERHRFVAGAL
jgi:hypothetical protein